MDAEARFTIGRLAAAADSNVQTIRYYEQIGMLPRPERSNGNQRQYGATDVDRLRFIRHARELGFPLEAIRDLLSLADRPESACDAADAIAQAQLTQVRQRIRRLQALEEELTRMILQCAGGRISDRRVIEALSDHTACGHGATPP